MARSANMPLTAVEQALHGELEALCAVEPEWLSAHRKSSWEKFGGLPTRANEEYHYTDLRQRLRAEPGDSGAKPRKSPIDMSIGNLGDLLISIDHGRVTLQSAAIPSGITFTTLARAIECDRPLAEKLLARENTECGALPHLSAALASDGIDLRVQRGHAQTIIVHNRTGGARLSHFVELEAGAEAVLIDFNEGAPVGEILSHQSTRISLAQGAHPTHLILSANELAANINGVDVQIGSNARYECRAFVAGSALARFDFKVAFAGWNAAADVSAFLLSSREEHIDFNLNVLHGAPNCASNCAIDCVAGIQGRIIARCMAHVESGANGTNSRQAIRGVLLGASSEIDAKPELRIFDDDVKCAHGTAIGALDESAIFYLRSRGIPEIEARMMLLEAIAEMFLSRIVPASGRELFGAAVTHALRNVILEDKPNA